MPAIEPTAEELALLRAAADRTITLPMKYGEAVHRRQRLYQCRKALAESKHWLTNVISVVRISINPPQAHPDHPATMTLSPGIDDFNTLIRSALNEKELSFGVDLDGEDLDTPELDFDKAPESPPKDAQAQADRINELLGGAAKDKPDAKRKPAAKKKST